MCNFLVSKLPVSVNSPEVHDHWKDSQSLGEWVRAPGFGESSFFCFECPPTSAILPIFVGQSIFFLSSWPLIPLTVVPSPAI